MDKKLHVTVAQRAAFREHVVPCIDGLVDVVVANFPKIEGKIAMLAFITYENIYTLDEQRTRFAYG